MNNDDEELTKSELEQAKRNKRIRHIFFANIIFFVILFLHVGSMALNHKDIAYSSYNSMTTYDNPAVMRGDILARDGEILATTDEDGLRRYPQSDAFAHTVGYYDYGRVGLENIYGVELEKVNLELFKYFISMFGVELSGNNVVTTLDLDLQNYIYDIVKDRKSAVVVLDAKTSDILAMVSTPSFDPNNVKDDWDEISTDEENTPLINRAIQGQYPPGSTFKVVTALAYMRYNPDYADYTYNCTGDITIDDTTIECASHKVHGEVDLEEALKVSCNCFFASLVNEMPPEELEKTANDLLFNEPLDFILPYNNSSFGFTDDDDTSVYMRTYIGQGNTLVTPLYLAQIFQAIANDGVMMKPHLVDEIQSAGGITVKEIKDEKIKRVMSKDEADTLTKYLTNVTKEGGTASALADLPYDVAGKTGSAQVDNGSDHGWFVGFAPAEDPEVVVCVLYENNGGSHYIMNDVKSIIEKSVEEYNKES